MQKAARERPLRAAAASGLAACAPSAIFSRSATVLAFSFSMMLARCASTVLMLMPRSSAICLFRRPATMRSSTCASRVVRRDSSASRLAASWCCAERGARLVEHALDQAEQLFFLERLLDEVHRALLHRGHRHRHVAVAGDEDDRQRALALASGGPAARARSCRPCGCRRSGRRPRADRSATGTTRTSRST